MGLRCQEVSSTEAVILIKATIDEGWHIYSTKKGVKADGPIPTSFTFPKSKEYTLVGKVTEPAPIKKYEDSLKWMWVFLKKQLYFNKK